MSHKLQFYVPTVQKTTLKTFYTHEKVHVLNQILSTLSTVISASLPTIRLYLICFSIDSVIRGIFPAKGSSTLQLTRETE